MPVKTFVKFFTDSTMTSPPHESESEKNELTLFLELMAEFQEEMNKGAQHSESYSTLSWLHRCVHSSKCCEEIKVGSYK